ncbi:MAG: 4-hydroxythreonine-4-phosphate dehydrogenase PdxA [Bosea sp. (in: a-proteobacteria)]
MSELVTSLPLLVTQGDPAGIGPELALRAWAERKARALPAFGWIGDPAALNLVMAATGQTVPLRETDASSITSTFDHALPVLPTQASIAAARPSLPDPSSAASTLEAIRMAVSLVHSGEAGGLVTMPIAKHVLYQAGFSHPGHTEFLAELASEPGKPAPLAVMLIWSDILAVVPVTIHIPLKDVPERLTTALIVDTARIVARDYRLRLGVERPRLALAGLNPHAGENGTMGKEDEAIILPAIRQLQAEGIAASGPHPADTMFHPRARSQYDVALGMYHDQVLIPAKTLAFDEGVNVTLGLPFIRTSPDHGTAFDIAGKGIARPDSVIAAIRLAGQLAARAAIKS